MTNRKRVYLPPIVEAAIATLRQEPGYSEATDATLLEILADRANRPAAVTNAPSPVTGTDTTPDDLGAIALDF